MKQVSQLSHFSNIIDICDLSFGTFYFFDGLVIGEMNEGAVIKWHHIQQLIEKINQILGESGPITYISNRINSYTVVLTGWSNFRKTKHFNRFKAYGIVAYTETVHKNFVLEALFANMNIKKFIDLEEAVEWCLQSVTPLLKKK